MKKKIIATVSIVLVLAAARISCSSCMPVVSCLFVLSRNVVQANKKLNISVDIVEIIPLFYNSKNNLYSFCGVANRLN